MLKCLALFLSLNLLVISEVYANSCFDFGTLEDEFNYSSIVVEAIPLTFEPLKNRTDFTLKVLKPYKGSFKAQDTLTVSYPGSYTWLVSGERVYPEMYFLRENSKGQIITTGGECSLHFPSRVSFERWLYHNDKSDRVMCGKFRKLASREGKRVCIADYDHGIILD